MPDPNAQRFTLLHLVVILGMVLFVITLLIPAGGRPREAADRIKCSSNLRQIGLAMKMYANGETRTSAYPRTRFSQVDAARPTVFTQPNAANPFTNDGPSPNDVTAALFLVLRTQEITTDVFICPTARNDSERMAIPPGKDIKNFSNFLSPQNLGYSIQNPYPTAAAEKAGFTWDDNMPADFAIMADKNPGVAELKSVTFEGSGSEQRKVNSPNHQLDGQNVLYADGHVDWSASAWAGLAQDNIYGHNAPRAIATTRPTSAPTTRPDPASPPPVPTGIIGPPADGNDSVLLPTADQKAP